MSPLDSTSLPLGKIGFSFKITPQAVKEGFSENDLGFLINQWLELGNIVAFLQRYQRYIKYFNVIITIVYFICWFYISSFFFYVPSKTIIVSPWPPSFGSLFRKSPIWHPPMRSP